MRILPLILLVLSASAAEKIEKDFTFQSVNFIPQKEVVNYNYLICDLIYREERQYYGQSETFVFVSKDTSFRVPDTLDCNFIKLFFDNSRLKNKLSTVEDAQALVSDLFIMYPSYRKIKVVAVNLEDNKNIHITVQVKERIHFGKEQIYKDSEMLKLELSSDGNYVSCQILHNQPQSSSMAND